MSRTRGQTVLGLTADQLLPGTWDDTMKQSSYDYLLGDLDEHQLPVVSQILVQKGISHQTVEGKIAFNTAEDRLQAIKALHNKLPRQLGYKWRDLSGREQQSSANTSAWWSWVAQQPIQRQFLTDTTKDPESAH